MCDYCPADSWRRLCVWSRFACKTKCAGSLEAALAPPRRRSLTGHMGLKGLAVPAAETGGSRWQQHCCRYWPAGQLIESWAHPPPTLPCRHRCRHVATEEGVRRGDHRRHPFPHAGQSEHPEEKLPASVHSPARRLGHAHRAANRWDLERSQGVRRSFLDHTVGKTCIY